MSTNDPRAKNVVFSGDTPFKYLQDYAAELSRVLGLIDASALECAVEAVERAARDGRHIYGVGNGGSAAIIDHLCCDWTKGTAHEKHPSIKTHSMVANSALLLAAANDFGFEQAFSKQVELYVEKNDVVVAISSSGNSPNILRAVSLAKERGATVIGMSGFAGGELKNAADISLFVPCNNYGIVEDAHQMLMHTIAQWIANGRDGRLIK